jgi:hypothetical protein
MRRYRSAAAERDYHKSNLLVRIDYTPSAAARQLAARLLNVHPAHREALSAALLDRMARELKVPPVKLNFLNQPQKHRRRDGRLTYKEYAYYHQEEGITIYNKTAVRRQYLAAKSYLDTLVHEFLHHLDYELLKLLHTYHTRGFYSRLGDLMAKLQDPRPSQLELFS